jgi:hypothetical protein
MLVVSSRVQSEKDSGPTDIIIFPFFSTKRSKVYIYNNTFPSQYTFKKKKKKKKKRGLTDITGCWHLVRCVLVGRKVNWITV